MDISEEERIKKAFQKKDWPEIKVSDSWATFKIMAEFVEAFEKLADETPPAVLLGNGFSQAWNPAIFNYASLLQVATFEDREDQTRALFERLSTWDFEAVMRTLLAAQTVAEVLWSERSWHIAAGSGA